jgi:hypothetical protein
MLDRELDRRGDSSSARRKEVNDAPESVEATRELHHRQAAKNRQVRQG